uniref:Uncharacterized protein n=2 Tax=Oryza TaxID=4527 RepID=A0A0E0RDM0_ORYRU
MGLNKVQQIREAKIKLFLFEGVRVDFCHVKMSMKHINTIRSHKPESSSDVQESASGQCELCILMTDYHSNSKTVEFFEGDVDHSYAVAIAPESKYSVHNMPGFIIHRSLEAASDSSESVYKGSEDYFTFACRYGDTSPNLVSRLITGPVFNLNGQVLGIVVDDIEYKFWPKKPRKEDGSQEIIHEDLFYRAGYFLKVAMRVNNLQQDLRSMVKDNDWQNGLKKIATERRV